MEENTKILLIDDDPDFVESTKDLLESYGYEVSFAYDGKSGLAKAQELKPDLMFLDVMMTSNTEGFDVARQIRDSEDLRNIPVIMMTGIREKMDLNFGFSPDEDWLPVSTVLEKPVEPARLISTVEKQLKRASEL